MVLIGAIIFESSTSMVWQGIVLGTNLKTSEAEEAPDQEYVKNVLVLIGAIVFSTFTNMVWQGIVLGTILEKVGPWDKHDQEHVEKAWSR